MMTKNEKKLNRAVNLGRKTFAVADALGTGGKFLAQVGIALLGIGLVSAISSDVCFAQVKKYRVKVREAKRAARNNNNNLKKD